MGFRGPPGPVFLIPLLVFGGMFVFRGLGQGRGSAGMIPMPILWIVGVVALVGVAVAARTLFGGSGGRIARPQRTESLDHVLVRIARANHGKILIGDVVERTDLSLSKARETLDEYAGEGNLNLDYDESGNIYYRLPGEPSSE